MLSAFTLIIALSSIRFFFNPVFLPSSKYKTLSTHVLSDVNNDLTSFRINIPHELQLAKIHLQHSSWSGPYNHWTYHNHKVQLTQYTTNI